MDKKTALTKVHENLESLLKKNIKALPQNFNQTRFLQNAMTVLRDTKGIEKVTPMSAARTMLKGAFLGLDFFNKECYAIPYGDELQMQTDYKGEIKIAKKYSIRPVKEIYAKVVRQGDHFQELIIDGRPSFEFKPAPFSKNPIVGVFAVSIFNDGGILYETMSISDVEKIRHSFSKQPNGKAWGNEGSYPEMVKKTCIRRLRKQIEIEFDNYEQQEAYKEAIDSEVDLSDADYEDIEMPEVIENENQDQVEEEIENIQPDLPEDQNIGRFVQWSELSEEEIRQVLIDIRQLAKEKDIKIGDMLSNRKIKSLTPKDMTVQQYWTLHDYLTVL